MVYLSMIHVYNAFSLCQASRFRDYAELTLLKVLEAHRDTEKDVTRSAEECAGVLATHLPPHVCLRVLNPVISNDGPPTLLAAVKMITKVRLLLLFIQYMYMMFSYIGFLNCVVITELHLST